MTDEATGECDLNAAKCTCKYTPPKWNLFQTTGPFRGGEKWESRVFKERDDSERKEPNSLSPAGSYKLTIRRVTVIQVGKIGEEISGITLMDIPPCENMESGEKVFPASI